MYSVLVQLTIQPQHLKQFMNPYSRTKALQQRKWSVILSHSEGSLVLEILTTA